MTTKCFILLTLLLNGIFAFHPEEHEEHGLKCQKWCYGLAPENKVVFKCCDYGVKHGECPKGCIFEEGTQVMYIGCLWDGNCPSTYKCCKDDCHPDHKICKPAIFNRETEALTPIP